MVMFLHTELPSHQSRSTMAKLFYFSAVIFFSASIDLILGQIVLPGNCPAYATHPQFNPAQFISVRWYEVLRYPSAFEQNTKCSLIDIKPSKQGALNMNFRGISTVDGSITTITGSAFFDYGQLSKFIVQVPVSSWNTTNRLHFWVMSTDYSNYALVWSCDPLCTGFRREQLWILSRQPTLNSTILQQISTNFFGTQFSYSSLVAVDQTNCPAIPNNFKNVNSDISEQPLL